MTQEEDFEPYLSHVELADDNRTILLNDDEKYSGRLPLDIFRKNKSFDEQTRIVESMIYNTCAQHGVDSITSENVRNCRQLLKTRPRTSKGKEMLAKITSGKALVRY